jgi:hypothetical protein
MVEEGKQPAEHIESLLDAALEQTFPASDPIAIDVPSRAPAVPDRLQL